MTTPAISTPTAVVRPGYQLTDNLWATQGQVFMTGTDPSLFASLTGRAQFLSVDHGTVGPTTGY